MPTGMRTAIIGAGLSGLTVGARRQQAGDEVMLFEKARGPGGRTSTRRAEPLSFDHGAQYFTARDPDFCATVEKWCSEGVVAPWEAPIVTLCRGEVGPDPKPGVRYVGTPRMSALARHLAEGLSVERGVRIASVERDERGWRLSAESGDVYEAFDRVIVTTPAAQAEPLLAARPDLARQAARATLAPCQAVMVGFADAPDVGFGGAFVEQSPISWLAAQHSRPGRPPSPAFVLHASPGWSQEHVDDPPEAVQAALLDAFAEAIGQPLPEITHGAAHRWLYALAPEPLDRGCLWESASGFGVCGDWLTDGRVEGAVRSGSMLADAIEADPG